MRHLIILITVLLSVYLASSSPIDFKRQLVNRPSVKEVFSVRTRRSDQQVKGGNTVPSIKRPYPLEMKVRKGEYVCGNKICKLEPGLKPDCPVCQYPL